MLDFRKYFFRKLLRPFPEEVVPEDTFGTTSSGIGASNFRKKFFRKLLRPIPEEVVPEVELALATSGRSSSGMLHY